MSGGAILDILFFKKYLCKKEQVKEMTEHKTYSVSIWPQHVTILTKGICKNTKFDQKYCCSKGRAQSKDASAY